jgi:ParB-like chromosome segregation protein Spo0J
VSSRLPFIAGQIVKRAVASLVPYARNARTHSAEQVEQLCASITEFGFTNPVLIDGRDGVYGSGLRCSE